MRGMRKKRFKHITYEERIRLELLHKQGRSLREIARALGRSHNAIAYELRQKRVKGEYVSKKAQHKTYWRRYKSKKGCMAVLQTTEVHHFVLEKIRALWSPERISGYLGRHGTVVSTKAIYKFVKSRSLERYLFWQRNNVRGGPKRGRHKKAQDGRRYIEKRPRMRGSGHLEADFIVSSKSVAALLVVVDRWTRDTRVWPLPDKKQRTVTGAFGDMRKAFGTIRTLTLDNDISFDHWRKLERLLHTKIFFTHPYHSWEKGLVENTNRWIRTFVPKRTDLKTVTENQCKEIEKYLNEIPRQCLGYKTATEMRVL